MFPWIQICLILENDFIKTMHGVLKDRVVSEVASYGMLPLLVVVVVVEVVSVSGYSSGRVILYKCLMSRR